MQTAYPLPNSPVVTTEQWSKIYGNIAETNVIKKYLNELQVYANSSGMNIHVKTGAAYMQGIYFESDAEETFAISAADATNPRIDRVVIRFDKVAETIELAILQGTPAVSPVAPAVTQNSSRWEKTLAQVRVNAGVVTIAADKVTDERYTTGFISPTFFNGWTISALDNNCRYWKDFDDMVHYEITVKDGSTAQNIVLFNFPPGYRPDGTVVCRGYCEDTTTGYDALYHIAGVNGEFKFIRAIPGNSLFIAQGSFKAVN